MHGALLAVALTLASAHGNPPTSPLSSDVKYFGGRVISNVKIVEISWGASVDSNYMTQLQGFYTAIVKSPFVDWMTEYDTIGLTGFADLQPGSNQHIGRGSFIGNVVITPANKSTIRTSRPSSSRSSRRTACRSRISTRTATSIRFT